MRQLSDETTLLRMAIKDVMAKATAPMTNVDVYESPQVRELGLSPELVSRALKSLHKMQRPPFPLKRVPHANGRSQWAYYNPKVVKLAYTPTTPREEPAPPVNGANPAPEFAFNPLEFAPPEVPTAGQVAPEPKASVKSVTVTVAGVSIKIDLEFNKTGE